MRKHELHAVDGMEPAEEDNNVVSEHRQQQPLVSATTGWRRKWWWSTPDLVKWAGREIGGVGRKWKPTDF